MTRSQMNEPPRPPPEKPSTEPEILPPERRGRTPSGRGDGRVWVSVGARHGERIYIARPGPITIFLAALLLGALAIAVVVLLLGLFLIWIPVAALVVTILVFSALIRGSVRRG